MLEDRALAVLFLRWNLRKPKRLHCESRSVSTQKDDLEGPMDADCDEHLPSRLLLLLAAAPAGDVVPDRGRERCECASDNIKVV